MIDTHAHIFAEEFESDLDEIVLNAKNVGVKNILLPNIDEGTIEALNMAVSKHNSFLKPMMGLHPTSVAQNWEEQLKIIYKELNKNIYIAIGEIGIDLHWTKDNLDIQKKVFEEQLRWSAEKQLPVSMHSRSALKEVIDSIKKVGEEDTFGVFHSFGGSNEELEEVLKLKNFYVGVNGVVTFKNSGLDKVLKNCPIDRIVLETDSPWLPPVPNRGKRNEPSYLIEIVKKLSSVYEMSESEVIDVTTTNALKVFNI